MVTGAVVLLFAAAFSTIGIDPVACARFGRYDRRIAPRDADFDPVVTTTASTTTTAVATKAPPNIPGKKTTTSSLTIISSALNLATLAVTTNVAETTPSTSSSTSTDYLDPESYGSVGTLTTESNAPTRSIAPSAGSISPSSSAVRAPVADTTSTSSSSSSTSTSTTKGTSPPKRPTLSVVISNPSTTATSTTNYNIETTSSGSGSVTTKTTKPPSIPGLAVSDTFTTASDLGHDGVDTATTTQSPSLTWTPIAGTSSAASAGLFNTTSTIAGGWNSTAPARTDPGVSSLETISVVSIETTTSYCPATQSSSTFTSYSIIYTSTITWWGNPSDYTPPYPEITTPATCVPSAAQISPARLTINFCTITDKSTTRIAACTTTASAAWAPETTTASTRHPGVSSETPTVVFLTTDKNPSVVYSTIQTPNYGVSVGATRDQSHASATVDPNISTPDYPGGSTQVTSVADHTSAVSPITVAVQPSGVVINGHTYSDNSDSKTTTVEVDGETFTIDPTEVVGASVTINRPSAVGGVFVPTPTSTTIDGIGIVVSSSVAVIDGTSFTIGTATSTAVVKGQTVTIGPSGVVVASQTVVVTSVPSPTEIVIAGGELITAIGQSVVVIDGTSITYGSGTTRVTVIDGDSITIAPSGVIVHGTTIGGPSAEPTDTVYEIVGGATITEIGASVVVIDGKTYTVGPGTPTTTTVIGGETLTIGPSGVAISTITFSYPFGPTTTITPGATAATSTAEPTATSTASEDAGMALRPQPGFLISCIAIGVMAFGI